MNQHVGVRIVALLTEDSPTARVVMCVCATAKATATSVRTLVCAVIGGGDGRNRNTTIYPDIIGRSDGHCSYAMRICQHVCAVPKLGLRRTLFASHLHIVKLDPQFPFGLRCGRPPSNFVERAYRSAMTWYTSKPKLRAASVTLITALSSSYP
jgi:hypothetical protein